MFDFYRHQRMEDCQLDGDGDMLLYQWGTYDWGNGESFEIDLTRQFIDGPDGEDEDIWQLSLTFRFPPTERLRNLGEGNKWCDHPDAVRELEDFVRKTVAFQTTSELHSADIELDYESV